MPRSHDRQCGGLAVALHSTTQMEKNWDNSRMEYLGVDELQQRAEELVKRAAAGERFGIVVDGRVVAWLVPPGATS
jgi:hypothetical protein